MSSETLPGADDLLSNRYRLHRRLGSGGMGRVYAATDEETGRACAVKLLRSELAGREGIRRRLRQEAEVASRLNHEHVVSVFDHALTEDGIPYLVMELLEGSDLAQLVASEGPLTVVRAVHIILQASTGLAAAHAQGVVHRDVKPSNIFICPASDGGDRVKLLDFGVARLTHPGSPTTHHGGPVGTIAYMPPEQVRDESGLDARVDVYSLGAVLYECLGGRPPFEADKPHALMHAILYGQPDPIDRLRSGLPQKLVGTVHRALAPAADDRFGSMSELRGALQRCLDSDPSSSRTGYALDAQGHAPPRAVAQSAPTAAPSTHERTLDTVGDRSDAPSTRPTDRGPNRRRRRATLWATAVAGIALTALGLVTLGRGEKPRDPLDVTADPEAASSVGSAVRAEPSAAQSASASPSASAEERTVAVELPVTSGPRGREWVRPTPAATPTHPDRATAYRRSEDTLARHAAADTRQAPGTETEPPPGAAAVRTTDTGALELETEW